jgi:probable rRNA maturation factor
MSIELNNESGVEVDELSLTQLARFVLDAMGINPLAELSVVLLDTDAMAALHLQWMDLPGPTDVMAFPMDGADVPVAERGGADPGGPPSTDPQMGQALLGDVLLCPEVARTQAKGAGHSIDAELQLLCAHGILHLLGYDHGEPDEEREMFELQARILGEWTETTGRSIIQAPLPGTGGEVRESAHGERRG